MIALLQNPEFRLAVNAIIVISCLYIVWRLLVIKDGKRYRLTRSYSNWLLASAPIGIGGNALNVSVVYTLAPRVNTLWGFPTPVFYTLGDILGALPFVVIAIVALKYGNIKLDEIGRILGMLENEIVDELKRKEEMITRLKHYLDVISHELQVPFTGMLGLSGILMRDMEPGEVITDDQIDIVGEMNVIAGQGHRLIEGLVDYTRMVRGEKFDQKMVDIVTVINEVISSIYSEIEDSNAKINWSPDDMPVVMVSQHINQVFSNLLRNAIKFRSDQDPVIDIACFGDGDHYHFTIRDNGIGFDMRSIDRVFAPLRSAHPDMIGQGVGVALSNIIIQKNGGYMWAESEVDKGAEFGFTLPR